MIFFPVITFCFLAVKELHDVVDEARAKAIRSTLISAVKFIGDQSYGFYIAKDMLRSICAQNAGAGTRPIQAA